MQRTLKQLAFASVIMLGLCSQAVADFEVMLPISGTKGGSYSVAGSFGGTHDAQFLIDTGAGMSTLSREMFKAVKKTHKVESVRKVAARLANGKLLKAQVYRIEDFRIGNQCSLGDVEVAVMPNSGRNIIGMDILAKTAPFGLNLAKPALAVSKCELIDAPPRVDLTLSH